MTSEWEEKSARFVDEVDDIDLMDALYHDPRYVIAQETEPSDFFVTPVDNDYRIQKIAELARTFLGNKDDANAYYDALFNAHIAVESFYHETDVIARFQDLYEDWSQRDDLSDSAQLLIADIGKILEGQ